MLAMDELKHLDRARFEYRDSNDAGVSPVLGPHLVFAICGARPIARPAVVEGADPE
jgi:hypothetical protein